MRKITVRIAGAPRVAPLPIMPWVPESEAPRRLRNFVEEMMEEPKAARQNVLGGPGIAVDGRLVSADLATDPGLEMDAEGVDGKVRVKPNPAKAILREEAGVGVGLAATPGLEMDGNNGVRVKADAGGAIQRSADGVGLVDGTADKQMLAWDHDPGKWDKILPDGVWIDVDLATGKLIGIGPGPEVYVIDPGYCIVLHGFSLDAIGNVRWIKWSPDAVTPPTTTGPSA